LDLLSKVYGKVPSDIDIVEGSWPSVSIIICAHNEESNIAQRIENIESLNYDGPLTIIVGSDASTDRTNSILRSYESQGRIKTFLFEEKQGKSGMINIMVGQSECDIIVMSDANTQFDSHALKYLVEGFNDQKVACVVGELSLIDGGSGKNLDGLYWHYEKALKVRESKLNALLGANGAIYAFRRNRFKQMPHNTINDDFTLCLDLACDGWRVLYESRAKATEEMVADNNLEYIRRVRIGKGNYQSFLRFLRCLNPTFGWLNFTYLSHKVTRWFVPHFMLLAIISNLFLLDQSAYQFTLAAQFLVYLVGLLSIWINTIKLPLPIRFLGFVLQMNIALAHGFLLFCFQRDKKGW